ncbi:MAG: hypothetical protein ABW019_09070 [Chitinophagaceae bacterium]
MQTIYRKKTGLPLLLAVFSVTMLSFAAAPGGDKFEIYLNNKLILEQFVTQRAGARYLTLHQTNYDDRISVSYSHCGQAGRDRVISIRDENNKVLKQWKFADAAGSKTMSWQASGIMDLQKDKSHDRLQLWYTSRELPDGKLLATVVRGNNNYARL